MSCGRLRFRKPNNNIQHYIPSLVRRTVFHLFFSLVDRIQGLFFRKTDKKKKIIQYPHVENNAGDRADRQTPYIHDAHNTYTIPGFFQATVPDHYTHAHR
jgi:hypothetical protein